ncbi:hypothetical protein HK096_000119, partial [Nowakowskiella sp. JEL0078]
VKNYCNTINDKPMIDTNDVTSDQPYGRRKEETTTPLINDLLQNSTLQLCKRNGIT